MKKKAKPICQKLQSISSHFFFHQKINIVIAIKDPLHINNKHEVQLK